MKNLFLEIFLVGFGIIIIVAATIDADWLFTFLLISLREFPVKEGAKRGIVGKKQKRGQMMSEMSEEQKRLYKSTAQTLSGSD